MACEISPIHTSSDLRPEESYDLINLFVEFVKSDQTSDEDNSHPNNGDPVNLTNDNYPHAICDLTQFTKCCYLSFLSSETC